MSNTNQKNNGQSYLPFVVVSPKAIKLKQNIKRAENSHDLNNNKLL